MRRDVDADVDRRRPAESRLARPPSAPIGPAACDAPRARPSPAASGPPDSEQAAAVESSDARLAVPIHSICCVGRISESVRFLGADADIRLTRSELSLMTLLLLLSLLLGLLQTNQRPILLTFATEKDQEWGTSSLVRL